MTDNNVPLRYPLEIAVSRAGFREVVPICQSADKNSSVQIEFSGRFGNKVTEHNLFESKCSIRKSIPNDTPESFETVTPSYLLTLFISST